MEPLSFTQHIQAYTNTFECASDKKTQTKAIWDSLRRNFQTELDDESIASLNKLKTIIVLANKPRLAAAIDAFIHKNSIFYRLTNDLKQEILSYLPDLRSDRVLALDPRHSIIIHWSSACYKPLNLGLNETNLIKALKSHGSEVKNFSMIFSTMSSVCEVLEHTPNIKFFGLRDCWDNNSDNKTAMLLKKFNSALLTGLNLSSAKLTDAVGQDLSGFSSLTSLYLSYNKFENVVEHLLPLTRLTKLDVSANDLSRESIRKLSLFTLLKELGLAQVQIGDQGAQLISQLPHLTALDLSLVELTIAGLVHLAALTNLRLLHLSSIKRVNNTFGGAAGASLLSSLTKLTDLDLSTNHIGDVGASHIQNFSHLTRLNLSGNQITAVGAESLSHLSKLTYLDLAGNIIGDLGVDFIVKLENLKILILASNSIGDKGTLCLTRLFKLEVINLCNNEISVQMQQQLSYDFEECRKEPLTIYFD